MQEVQGNFWSFVDMHEAILVTTNGIVKHNGELVMGGGIALQFRNKYPWLAKSLGRLVNKHGNIPFVIGHTDKLIISMPTKEHYKNPSPISLITNSAKAILDCINDRNIKTILATRPGCGLGGQNWVEIKQTLKQIGWDDRFTIVNP